MASTKDLRAAIEQELPSLLEIRHDLHAHPELKYEEQRTSGVVKHELDKAGISYKGGLAGGTGVLGFIPGKDEARCVALRADMDALPILEQTDLPYASREAGKMHACGHDGHTTILLGASRVLRHISEGEGLPRPVKLFFQPAEEGGAGGERMVNEGCLGGNVIGPSVTEMYGLHGWPELELGKVSTKPGALLAATDAFTIRIQGEMCHAAAPHLGRDPVVAGAQVVTALQTIVSRNVHPVDPIVVSVAKFHAGTAYNVLPDEAVLEGTMRTLSPETRVFGKRRIYDIAGAQARVMGCKAEIEWRDGYPVTVNDTGAVERFFGVARDVVGKNNAPVFERPAMVGEDFSYYGKQVPACFFLLGQAKSSRDAYPGLHTPTFDFNDDAIALGVELFCRLALM
ncbi:MAG: amidohydrolase [Planctomycetota bacterium]